MGIFGPKRKRKETRRECRICAQRALGGAEIYELRGAGGASVFEVGRAKEIVSDGRTAEAVSPAELKPMVEANETEPAHLGHVNLGTPGIIGRRYSGRFLLDGAHRAARSLAEGTEFSAYMLSPEETRSCLVTQDIWESDAGLAARDLRQLLESHPEAAVDVEVDWSPQAVQQVRKLLTSEENSRIKIRRVPRR